MFLARSSPSIRKVQEVHIIEHQSLLTTLSTSEIEILLKISILTKLCEKRHVKEVCTLLMQWKYWKPSPCAR